MGGIVRAAAVPFLLFVLCLGLVVQALVGNGLGTVIARVLPHGSSLPALLAIAAIAAATANLVNNLPAVLVLLAAVTAGGTPPGARRGPVLAILIGVNIGPNLTYAGSLATLLWRRLLAERDHDVDLAEFTRLGLATVPLGLVAATAAPVVRPAPDRPRLSAAGNRPADQPGERALRIPRSGPPTRRPAPGRAWPPCVSGMPRPTATPIRYAVTGAAGRSTLCATSRATSRIARASAEPGSRPRSLLTVMIHRSIALMTSPVPGRLPGIHVYQTGAYPAAVGSGAPNVSWAHEQWVLTCRASGGRTMPTARRLMGTPRPLMGTGTGPPRMPTRAGWGPRSG